MSLALLQETTEATQPAAAGDGLASIITIGVLGFIGVLVAALVVVGLVSTLRRPAAGAQEKSWLDYGNFFIVLAGIGAVLVAFLIALLNAEEAFRDATQVIAILTALFGVIGTLVGTYFGVKAGSDAAQGAQTLASSTLAPAQPAVVAVEPTPNAVNVPANTLVTVTFSKDMNPATLTNLTFTLAVRDTGNPVPNNTVTYDPLTKRATLTPNAGNGLAAGTAYRATITSDVRDQAGNALPAARTWDFTVA